LAATADTEATALTACAFEVPACDASHGHRLDAADASFDEVTRDTGLGEVAKGFEALLR